MVVLSLLLFRSAQPRTTEEQSRQIFEKGGRIEQEFAEYFTGEGGVDLESDSNSVGKFIFSFSLSTYFL